MKISRKEIFPHNSTCTQPLPGEKMPNRCAVGGCLNENDPERKISLHKILCFGEDCSEAKARRKKWVDFMKLRRAKWEPTAHSRVCLLQFSNSEDFEAQFSIPGVKRRQELIKDDIGPIPVPRFHRNLWEEEELSDRSRCQVCDDVML